MYPFYVVIHYQGKFSGEGESPRYEGWLVSEVRFDPLEGSYDDFCNRLKGMGYLNIHKIWYCIPTLALSEGLKELADDESAIDLLTWVLNYDKVDMYIEHGIDTPDIVDDEQLNLPPMIEHSYYNQIKKHRHALIKEIVFVYEKTSKNKTVN